MATATTTKKTTWITGRAAVRLLLCARETFYKHVRAGRIAKRSVPGAWVKYSRADVEALISVTRDGACDPGV